MSRVSQHLHGLHKAMHQDRTDAIANHQAALEKAAAMEPAGGTMTTFLKAEIDRHQKAADHHSAAMEECGKAIAAEDLTKRGDGLEPTRISAIAPERAEVRMVARVGGPPVPEQPLVAEGFEKLVSIED